MTRYPSTPFRRFPYFPKGASFAIPLIGLLALFSLIGCATGPRRPLSGSSSNILAHPEIIGWAQLPQSLITINAEGVVSAASLPLSGSSQPSLTCRIAADSLPLFSSAVSADGQLAAVAMRGLLRIVSLPDCRPVAETRLIDSRVGSITFSPDARSVVLGAFDGKVYRWRFTEGGGFSEGQHRLFERYVGHGGVVSGVAFHPAGRVFFSADWTGLIRAWLCYDQDVYKGRWDIVTGPGRFYTEVAVSVSAARLSEPVDALAVTEGGDALLSATRDGSIQLWSIRGFLLRGQTLAHDGQLRSIALGRDGRLAATSGRDGFIRQWRISVREDDDKVVKFEKIGEWYQPNNRFVTLNERGLIVAISDSEIQLLEAPRL